MVYIQNKTNKKRENKEENNIGVKEKSDYVAQTREEENI